MLILLSREEILGLVKKSLGATFDVQLKADIGFVKGDLTLVAAVNEDIPEDFFEEENEEDQEDSANEGDTPANSEDKPAKGKGKSTGKRTRRTRAQIEEDERREREQAEADQKEQGKETPVVAPVETQTEVPADEVPPFAVDAPVPEVVEQPKDENLFGATDPVQEPVKEEASSDAGLFDTGATNNPFAEPGDAVAESSDTNLFNVDPVEGDSEFQKPAEDNTEVFNLFK